MKTCCCCCCQFQTNQCQAAPYQTVIAGKRKLAAEFERCLMNEYPIAASILLQACLNLSACNKVNASSFASSLAAKWLNTDFTTKPITAF